MCIRDSLKSLRPKADRPLRAPMVTLCIQGGKKDKLRPGDLLGACLLYTSRCV